MAAITFYQAGNMLNPGIWYGTVTSASASSISLSDGAGRSGTYYGSFTYNSYGLSGGTVTSYDNYANWSLDYTVQNVSLNAVTVNNYLNSGNATGLHQYGLSGHDTITGSGLADSLRGWGGNDIINSGAGNDTLNGDAGNDTLDGGTGVDIASYTGNRANFTVTQSGTGFIVTDSTGAEGTDTATNIERLFFADTRIALDITDGNAGTTAKILGVVFGAASVSNTTYAGIGLSYLDGGMSYADLMALALNARLGVGFSNADEVNLLYQNLVGTLPSVADLDYWIGTITSGQFTQASIAVMVADHNLNTTNINLVGLAQTGIEFI